MCDIWLGILLVHHNQARANFFHFHLTNLNSKQNTIWGS